MGEMILTTKNLCRDFKIGDGSVVHALKNINIEIEKGKLTILRGRSGSGKTTLINILGALDKPTDGTVDFNGQEITSLSERKRDELRRYQMAFVFQSVALISSMTAKENVEFGLRLAKFPYEKRSQRADEVLKKVGLDKRSHHRPGEMSGGEQQRVAIARAIAHQPAIVFADEPTAELDTTTSLHIVKLFKDLVKDYGMTIIMTTHDPSMIDIADKVYTLEDGEIVE
ncbi:MAG: ABC transporter ATP-binding protein [Ruminococcus sp.]|nr:ABC transporter ATP-binding protein [Ruminococcus sp.]